MVKRCTNKKCLTFAEDEDVYCGECGGDLTVVEKWCPQCCESRAWKCKFCVKCRTSLEERTDTCTNPICAEVLYDYCGEDDDELVLITGEIVSNVSSMSDGWSLGELNGKVGLFPSQFVKILSSHIESKVTEPLKTEETLLKGTLEEKAETCNKPVCAEVLYDYCGEDHGDLVLITGEIINNVSSISDGWSLGELNGKVGLFPSQFVKILTTPVESKITESSKTEDTLLKETTYEERTEMHIKPVCAEVLYDYFGEDDNDLILITGKIVNNVSSVSDGWSRGELNGKVGLFPSQFVKILDTPVESKVSEPLKTEEGLPKGVVKGVVKFDYEGIYDGELTLIAGTIIEIIDSNIQSGWYQVKFNGSIGMFPSCYVQIMNNIQSKVSSPPIPAKRQPSVLKGRCQSMDSPVTARQRPVPARRQSESDKMAGGKPVPVKRRQSTISGKDEERVDFIKNRSPSTDRPVAAKRRSIISGSEKISIVMSDFRSLPATTTTTTTKTAATATTAATTTRYPDSVEDKKELVVVQGADIFYTKAVPIKYEQSSNTKETGSQIKQNETISHPLSDSNKCNVGDESINTSDGKGLANNNKSNVKNESINTSDGKGQHLDVPIKVSSKELGMNENIQINFMVTVHSSKSNLSQKDRVFIYFGHSKLGNFEHPGLEMTKGQKMNGSFTLWTGMLMAPKSYLTTPIPYKYVVWEADKIKYWEYLYFGKFIDCNRLLWVCRDKTIPEFKIFFQIDDCILPTYNVNMAKSFWKSVTSQYDWNNKMHAFGIKNFPQILQLFLKEVVIVDEYICMLFMIGLIKGFYESYAQALTGSTHIVHKVPEDNQDFASHAMAVMKEGEKVKQKKIVDQIQFIMKVLTIACYMNKQSFPTRFLTTLFKSLSMEDIQFHGDAKPLNNALAKFPDESLIMIEDALSHLWVKGLTRQNFDYATSIWYPLVIIHVISGRCLLFREPPRLTHINAENCGLLPVENISINIQFLSKLFANLKEIKNSLKMDKLLQRSILFLMQSHHYEKVLNSGYFDRSLFLEMVANNAGCKNATKEQLSALKNVLLTFQGSVDAEMDMKARYGILNELVKIAIATGNKYEVNPGTGAYFQVLIDSLNTYLSYVEKVENNEHSYKEIEEICKIIKKCLPDMYREIDNCLRRSGRWNMLPIIDINIIIQVAEKFYSLKFERLGQDTEDLRRKILIFFYEKLRDFGDDTRKFLEVYGNIDTEKFPLVIQNVFENVCTEKLDAIAKDIGSWTSYYFQSWFNDNFAILCSYFSREWEKKKTTMDRICHCVNWAPMKSFFDTFGNMMRKGQGKYVDNSIQEAYTLVKATSDHISQSIEVIEMLEKRKEPYFELLAVIYDDGGKNLHAQFDKACLQVKTLRNGIAVLDYFLEIGKSMPDRTCNLRKLKKVVDKDISSRTLNEIFYEQHGLLEYFGVSKDLWDVAQQLFYVKIGDSFLFKTCLEHNIKRAISTVKKLDVDTLVENVIRPTLMETKTLFVEVLNGRIRKKQVVKQFKKKTRENLHLEFIILRECFQSPFSDELIKECISRIQTLLEFEKCVDICHKIKVIAETFNLNGDFNNIYKFYVVNGNGNLVSDSGDLCLKDIDEHMINDVMQMVQISPKIIDIISYIERSLKLFAWLRENLKSSKEVKVFIEMMSISAGETDYEVDRVKCFEATCSIFGPIIFDLTETSGYLEFSKACANTAKNLGEDKRIIEKLFDSNRNLEWFKDARNSQGSVETRSLKEAIEANKNGTYIVGNFHHNKFLYKEVTVKEVIKLTIENGDHMKEFSLEEINDLQSRLMLLGGDIDKQTEDNMTREKSYFVQMSELITRLAKVYVALIEVGSIKYFDWSKNVKCNIDEAAHVGMDEYFEQHKADIIKLEHHLKEQEETIAKYRESNPLLNHLTVKQCLMLQRFLYYVTIDIKHVNKLPAQVFTLLRSVTNDVNVAMVRNAILQSFSKNDNTTNEAWKMAETENRSNYTDKTYRQLEEILHRLKTKFKVHETMAYAALHCNYPYDETKALMWCRKQKIDSDMVCDAADTAELEMIKLKEEYEESEINLGEEKEDLNDFPVKFMALEQLGCFLNALLYISSDKSGETRDETLKKRPENLNHDKPSLIILPQDEILCALLYLYLYNKRGLPTSKDVLLCNDDVSMEQIELILRRASDDTTGLYCLAFLDQLEYEINVKTFSFVEKQTKKGIINNLVIFCSKENENKSFLVSALDDCKVYMPAYYSKESIVQLLEEQLRPHPTGNKKDMEHAASVDIEGYNTRLIASDRGGMGKTLFVSERVSALQAALHRSRKYSTKSKGKNKIITIPVQGTHVDTKGIVDLLLQFEEKVEDVFPRIYHFDISPMISHGLSCFLFNAVVLGCLQTRTGNMWRKSIYDLCIIEVTMVDLMKVSAGTMFDMLPTYNCMSPQDAYEYLQDNTKKGVQHSQIRRGINEKSFKDDPIQRVYQYLKVYDSGGNLNRLVFQQSHVDTDHKTCLKILLKYCGVINPTWMELRNFVHFFNQQLMDSEKSIYTSSLLSQDLRGFKAFVVKFLLLMSKDFATRSLTDDVTNDDGKQHSVMVQLKRRWEHSSHPYLFFNQDGATLSFVGFNVTPDGDIIELSGSTQVINSDVKMSKVLYQDLMLQMSNDEHKLKLDTDYRNLSRNQKLVLLCRVMGVEHVFDPDETYELTMDNVTKILAIHMRIRCGIPVILMGETGCGKTRLIRFMCDLNAGMTNMNDEANDTVLSHGSYDGHVEERVQYLPQYDDGHVEERVQYLPQYDDEQIEHFDDADSENDGSVLSVYGDSDVDLQYEEKSDVDNSDQSDIEAVPYVTLPVHRATSDVQKEKKREKIKNMYLVKVHGGVTAQDLLHRIQEAKTLAKENLRKYNVQTILFLDEANTTAGIDVINEVMVDKRAQGEPLNLEENGLQIIAACNPYRQHSEAMVERLESAGLGYHISAALAHEKIGDIPLRQLVYRVHQLPESMKTLVWDFGQLTAEAEEAYAKQIIERYEREGKLPSNDGFVDLLVNVLAASQVFMRTQKNECSFVSLRDVERAVQVCSWFHAKLDNLMAFEESEFNQIQDDYDRARRSLVLALGVCYIARLESRDQYMENIAKYFTGMFKLNGGAMQIKDEIAKCQKSFVYQLNLDENIAMNNALCENVFMMVICIELRIPLFVVGKPGSSKSLAKTIVQDNMQGYLSKSKLFCQFKQIFMSAYQCSPLSTAEGITSVFKQCTRFQKDKNLDQYASVVVLDEVGLAEDSPAMPLKVLHPLLEDGTDGSEDLTLNLSEEELASKRCSFIGISNWALDPAKMNRGIMLCRGSPDLQELVNTAKDICAGDEAVQRKIKPLLRPLAKGYLEIYEDQKHNAKLIEHKKKEFFGLRDFYSLVKMVFCFARKCKGIPSVERIEHAVRRNFSGLQDVDTWKIFQNNLRMLKKENEAQETSQGTSTTELIQACFQRICSCYEVRGNIDDRKRCTNVRYLLIMTEDYSALPLIHELFLDGGEDINVIFGSSFPRDQHFTQVCRNINRIKMYMETGKTVVLLNMENLYESLYDALNQYYVYLGGQSYVDLGLGTHRVKCRVHDDFRLIVIADRETVYQSFPIPLINRLEKHFFETASCLTQEQKKIVDELQEWVHDFAYVKSSRHQFLPSDAFIGYNADTCASMVMTLYKNMHQQQEQKEILQTCKRRLLYLATPDSLARVSKSSIKYELNELWQVYFEEQEHSSLLLFLQKYFDSRDNMDPEYSFIQVTTFSRLLSPADKEGLQFGFHVQLISLMQFQTEHAFQEEIKLFLQTKREEKSLLIIQCIYSPESVNLVTCAQHMCKEVKHAYRDEDPPIYFLFLLQLGRIQGGCKGISTSQSTWKCIHIDELRPPTCEFPSLVHYAGHSLSTMFDFNEVNNRKQYSEVTNLIKGCIPTATKKLCELKEMLTDDISNMISLLNKIMAYVNADYHSDDGDLSQKFIKITMKHMSNCLRKKEALSEDAGNWIYQEAIEQKHSQDYGTFREALVHCVEEHISDIFMSLLFEMDHGNNLVILMNEQYQHIWIKLYETSMKDILMRQRNFPVQRTKETFRRRFPFSKQLIQSYEDMIKTHGSQEVSAENVLQLAKVVSTQPFAAVVKDLSCAEIKDYIHDIIHSTFTCERDMTYDFLSDALFVAMKQLILQLNEKMERRKKEETCEDQVEENVGIEMDLLLVHCTLFAFEERLQHANALFTIQPGIVQYISNNVHEDDTEMVVDVHALRAVLMLMDRSDDTYFAQISQNDWLTEVKQLKITVKVQLSHSKKSPSYYGDSYTNHLDYCRIMWTQLQVIQMYLDITTPREKEKKKFHRKSVAELIKRLNGIEDDMRSIESWNVVEIFLRDVVNERKKQSGSRDVDIGDMEKRFLTLFVELVSEFCFSRDNFSEIDKDVISKIIGYAFHTGHAGHTRMLSPLDQYVDTTPVIRAYILQQLMKEAENVGNYVEHFLTDNLKFAKSEKDTWDICKLFIYCFEDNHLADLSLLPEQHVYIAQVTSCLESVYKYLRVKIFDEIHVELLENIALARSSFTSVASILAIKFLPEKNELDNETEKNLRSLVAILNRFMLLVQNEEGHMFLLRQIIHQFGSGDLEKIIYNSGYEFLQIKKKDDEIAADSQNEPPNQSLSQQSTSSGVTQSTVSQQLDRNRDEFLVYNKIYKGLKDQISRIILNKGKGRGNDLQQLIEMFQQSKNNQVMCGLAMLHEHEFCPAGRNEVIPSIVENLLLREVMGKGEVIGNVIHNKNIAHLLQHLMVVMHFHPDVQAMHLFSYIVSEPRKLNKCFFPAMPGDAFVEVRELNVQNQGNSFLFHQCPNGHPYVIGNCGNAVAREKCPECGVPIGGQNHQLDVGNTVINVNRDTSEKSHCLGEANTRPKEATPERNLSPLSTVLQHALIHISMLLGVIIGNRQHIANLVRPPINVNEVERFLTAHVNHDIRLIGKCLGRKSTDKAIIAIHLLIKHLIQANIGNIDVLGMLKSLDGRKMYEQQFHQSIIEDFVRSVTKDIHESDALILNELTMDANPTMRRLYELDAVPVPPITNIDVASCSQFWMYRQPITLSEFKLQVQLIATNKNKNFASCQTLWKFLEQDHMFTLIASLPDLLELQKILFTCFNYRIDKTTAGELSIRKALEELPKGDIQKKAKKLVMKTIMLWQHLSPFLKNHGRLRPEVDYHLELIDKNTPLQYFLCSLRGPGRFAMGMMDLLTSKQNEFLEYCSSTLGFSKPRQVSLLKVKHNDLIMYKAERDLLPIIVGFCEYASETGQGQCEVKYNMEAIERHFIEKMYFGRAHVKFVAEQFIYRDDIHSSLKFKLLNDAIQQTKIPYQERKSMMNELGDIRDVSNALRCVEIALGFLSSTGGDPNVLYRKYISDVLHMNVETFIASKKMQTSLRLTHMSSMWIMLEVEKARRLHLTNQNPFFMEQHFRVELDDRRKGEVKNNLKHADPLGLLDLLTEYIVSELPAREENAAELPLLDALEIYEDNRVGSSKVNVGTIAEEIQLMHVYSFWKIVADFSGGIIELIN